MTSIRQFCFHCLPLQFLCNVSNCFNLTKIQFSYHQKGQLHCFIELLVKINWDHTCKTLSKCYIESDYQEFLFTKLPSLCVSLNFILFKESVNLQSQENRILQKALLINKRIECESWYIYGNILHEDINFSF